MCAIGSVPYCVALLKTGNPVFPFMNDVFKSQYYPSKLPFTTRFSKDYSIPTLIYDLTFHTDRFLGAKSGAFGFLWFVFIIPSVLFLKKKTHGLIKFCIPAVVIFVACVFSKQTYLRYIVPTLPLLALLICNYLYETKNRPFVGTLNLGTLIAIVLLNAWFFGTAGWHHRGLIEKDFTKYISHTAPERLFVDYLNKFDPGANVLFVGGRFFPTGLRSEAIGDTWYFPEISKKLRNEPIRAHLQEIIKRYKIRYIIGNDKKLSKQSTLKAEIKKLSDEKFRLHGRFLSKLRDKH